MANVYLITGASSDVGTALIQRILQEGDTVIAQGSGDLAQLAPLCKAHPGQIHTYDVDLTDGQALDLFLKDVQANYPTPTHLVHLPALRMINTKFKKFDEERFELDLSVQVRSAIRICKTFLPAMAKAKRGRVLFMLTSYQIGVPPKNATAYIMVKSMLGGFARSLEKALWYTAFFLSLWCTAYCLRAQELDFRYMCPAFALAGGWTFWCDRREADHRPLRRLLFWLGWLPGMAAYLFILRSTLIALCTTFMYLFWPAVCGTAALLLKPRPTRRHRAAAALLAAGLLLACAVPKLCLVLETGWHCEPITAIQPERITRGPAAGTWADTKAADMQECLYEALAPYAGKSVLQAIGEQHGLGFLMADGTLTVAQASVISGTDSDPRFEQYYALLPEKQPDVILYDDAEVRDMAEFHAWIEQHFTITDRYTVQHGTASLQVLVVG